MIFYQDYFKVEKNNTPYLDIVAEHRDILAMIDMVIDAHKMLQEGIDDSARYVVKSQFAAAMVTLKGRLRLSDTPLANLTRRFMLQDYSLFVVMLSLSVELSAAYGMYFRKLSGQDILYPTYDVANQLYGLGYEDGKARFAECFSGKNVLEALLLKHVQEEVPFAQKKLCLRENVIQYLITGQVLSAASEGCISLLKEKIYTSMMESYLQQLAGNRIFLLGQDIRMKQLMLQALAQKENKCLVQFDCKQYLEADISLQLQNQTGLYLLLGEENSILFLKNAGIKELENSKLQQLISYVEDYFSETLIYADIYFEEDIPDREMRRLLTLCERNERYRQYLDFQTPVVSAEDCKKIWIEALGVGTEDILDSYDLNMTELLRIVDRVKALSVSVPSMEEQKKIIMDMQGASFGSLATRLQSQFDWDDIELENSQIRILKLACHRHKVRKEVEKRCNPKKASAYGNGVSVVLYGASGTGKTMAAQIMSKELGLPLYRVDLSQLTSKYIGETEKNLSKVFDEAAKNNVVLFFDEADVVFSKRTEVNDSKDKNANTETAFLLQKLEAYGGFVIIATNLVGNFDSAFMRRITYAVSFDLPDKDVRLKLWQKILPADYEQAEPIDIKLFADSLEITGSEIKSIVKGAIYLADKEKMGLTNRHIVESLRMEHRKVGKMLMGGELGAYREYYYNDGDKKE